MNWFQYAELGRDSSLYTHLHTWQNICHVLYFWMGEADIHSCALIGRSPLLNSLNSFAMVWSWLLLPSESPGITYHVLCLLRFHMGLSRQARKADSIVTVFSRGDCALINSSSQPLPIINYKRSSRSICVQAWLHRRLSSNFPPLQKENDPIIDSWVAAIINGGKVPYLTRSFTQWEGWIFWKTPTYEEITGDNPHSTALALALGLLLDFFYTWETKERRHICFHIVITPIKT